MREAVKPDNVHVHIPALDGLRGLAVCIVFAFHFGGGARSSILPIRLIGSLNKGGWSGVTLFFVLSGFLITGILWDSFADPRWWRSFFIRRSLRIFPVYYLAVLLLFLGSIPMHASLPTIRMLWIPALFLGNIPHLEASIEHVHSLFTITQLWSVAVEEQFYLVWPWLLLLFARRGTPSDRSRAKWLCITVFSLSFVFRLIIWLKVLHPGIYGPSLPTQAGALAMGGWLALSYRGTEWGRVIRIAPVLLIAGALGFLASGICSHNFDGNGCYMFMWGLPSATLLYTGLIALALTGGVISRLVSGVVVRWLGTISYGIYVYQDLVLHYIDRWTIFFAGRANLTAQHLVELVLAALVSLVLAQLSFHFFEKPFLQLRKYFVTTRNRPAAADVVYSRKPVILPHFGLHEGSSNVHHPSPFDQWKKVMQYR